MKAKSHFHVIFVFTNLPSSTCDSSFQRKHVSNNHILSVHEGKRPFECNECSSKFAYKSNMRKHIYSVHERKNLLNAAYAMASFQSMLS